MSAELFRAAFDPKGRPPKTVLHALARAATGPEGITLLPEDEDDAAETRTYGELAAGVWKTAAGLQASGVQHGERVLLVLPTGWAFIETLLACQLLGAIAVPAYPPPALQQVENALQRLRHMVGDAGITSLVTDNTLAPVMAALGAGRHRVKRLLVHSRLPEGSSAALRPQLGDIAFLQYTSGSTHHPKGVVIRHEALVANIVGAGAASNVSRSDRMVSWLPLYHDMGLVGGLLWPIYHQIDLVLMSPMAFLATPHRWLRAISDYQGTITMGPNFAYARALKRVRDLDGLDLSSWRVALNGAEPVSEETATAFLERFGPVGYRAGVMYPCYGLAEAVVAVSFSVPDAPLVVDRVDPEQLRQGRAVPSEAGIPLVACGRAIPGHALHVVDDRGNQLDDRQVGQIVVEGPSVMREYWNNPDKTAEALGEHGLLTGDLGYLHDGYLFVTGRIKDLIIVRGKNFHAEDVELAAELVEGVRPGGTVALSEYDAEAQEDRVVLVVEASPDDPQQLHDAIAAKVSEELGLSIALTHFVPRGAIPRTPSGKRQRNKTKHRLAAGTLRPPSTRAVWVATRAMAGATTLALRKLIPGR